MVELEILFSLHNGGIIIIFLIQEPNYKNIHGWKIKL